MKFKVGDKVVIKPLEEIKKLPNHIIRESGDIDGSCKDTDNFGNVITAHNSFVNPMAEFCGKEAVVERVSGDCNYKLEHTNNWSFIACWLERAPRYVETFNEE